MTSDSGIIKVVYQAFFPSLQNSQIPRHSHLCNQSNMNFYTVAHLNDVLSVL